MKQNEDQAAQKKVQSIVEHDEAKDILSRIPSFFPNAITGIFLLFLVLLFVAGFRIKYPDVVTASARILSDNPAISIVSPANGQILLLADGKNIKKGQQLALIQNNTDLGQVTELKKLINISTNDEGILAWTKQFREQSFLKLGEIADSYNRLALETESFRMFLLHDKSKEEIIAMENQLGFQRKLLDNQSYYEKVMQEKMNIAKRHLRSDSALFRNNALTEPTVVQSYMSFLNSQSESLSNTASGYRIQDAINGILVNSMLKREAYRRNFDQHLANIRQLLNEVLNRIYVWERHYLITSPIDGDFEEFGFIKDHFFASAGQQLFSIIPVKQKFYAVANMPAIGAGKVEKGLPVNIKLNDYPYDEFGMIKGEVTKISSVTQEVTNVRDQQYMGIYTVSVNISSNTSTFNKKVTFKNQMPAVAEIITKDRSIMSRILDRVVSIFQ